MKKLLAATFSAAALGAFAIPQAPVVTYGMVRDEFGNPLKDSAGLVLKLVKADAPDGQVYASTVVADTPYPGVNYRLSLEMDSTGPERSYAVTAGTQMRIKFLIGSEEQSATPSPVFAAPANGTAQRLDYSLGDDADGDGVPDAWEAWVLDIAGLSHDAAAIAAFKPGDDSDGDGMSNMREFLAGTDPFLDTDLFEITSFEKLPDVGLTEIKFTTVPGRTYRLVASSTLNAPVWSPVMTSRTAVVPSAYETYPGTGRIITVYMATSEASSEFFRVAAN